MQAGNDFLPSIASLEIYGRPSGLDILLKTYKQLLPALGGPITNGSVINPDRLKRILAKLAEDEEDAFQRLTVSQADCLCPWLYDPALQLMVHDSCDPALSLSLLLFGPYTVTWSSSLFSCCSLHTVGIAQQYNLLQSFVHAWIRCHTQLLHMPQYHAGSV